MVDAIRAEAERRVVETVERTQDDLVSFLGEFLRFPSINPAMLSHPGTTQMRACQEWLADRLQSWAVFDEVRLLAPDPEQPNVVARRMGRDAGNALLFNGHCDVVPVTAEQAAAWTLGTPWGGEVIGGKVYGRGASDMKGGCASFVWAIKSIAEAGLRVRGDLIATLVSGEETGNHNIGIDTLAEAGVEAPFAILAEPTDLAVCPATVGEFYFHIRVDGVSTSLANRHLAVFPGRYGVPVSGVNAIDKMWKIQGALAQLEREWSIWQRHPLMVPGNMNINFSRIRGGETYSAMADRCELTGSVLFNPALSVAEVVAEFRKCIEGVSQSDYWLREHPPTVTIPYILDAKEPINVSPDHPGSRALLDACRRVFDAEPRLGCTSGTSDGNYVAARGQSIVTMGPGDGSAGVHGSNEYVGVDNLVKAAKVYALTALEWCGVANGD
jgi:acetylornithine deacetylase/succinyl-diaminopimelate desuccinylase-like protein